MKLVVPNLSRSAFVLATVAASAGVAAAASPRIVNIRFGIVHEVSSGVFDFLELTTRIPRKLKESGFRFGIGFENPDCVPIEWYEQVHLP